MAKYKIKAPISVEKPATAIPHRVIWKIHIITIESRVLPELSTKNYTFSAKAVEKKKRTVRHNLRCAEDIIMQELGQATTKKKEKASNYPFCSYKVKKASKWWK